MDRYRVKRGGDVDRWGNYYILDGLSGSTAAMCTDAEMADKIADLLNAEPKIELLLQKAEAFAATVMSKAGAP